MIYTKGYNLQIKKTFTQNIYKIKKEILFRAYHLLKSNKFTIAGKQFTYYFNRNNSIDSERVIEIPLSYWFVKSHPCFSEEFFELGNTLNQYFKIPHIVVDKYEIAEGVINEDIIDFKPKKKFKLIISISTIEHIGFDEPQKEEGKALKATKKLIDMLSENGSLLITVPLGYNQEIDEMLKERKINFTEMYFMKRVSKWNYWEETILEDALTKKYNSIYPFANAVAFLVVRK